MRTALPAWAPHVTARYVRHDRALQMLVPLPSGPGHYWLMLELRAHGARRFPATALAPLVAAIEVTITADGSVIVGSARQQVPVRRLVVEADPEGPPIAAAALGIDRGVPDVPLGRWLPDIRIESDRAIVRRPSGPLIPF
jgi:hypothetical protein